MMVEVYGCGFGNKGGQLMLYAAAQHLRQASPGAKIVVQPGIGSYEERARWGLYQKMRLGPYGRLGSLIDFLMHRGYRERFGMVAEEEIDAVLDASGYAYGDAWGPEPTERAVRLVARWKKPGKKYVLLPQAFGPFGTDRIRRAFLSLLERTDLVFARDAESLQHIRALKPDLFVDLAPDFTNLVDGQPAGSALEEGRWGAIVPNYEVLHRSSPDDGAKYVAMLAFACDRLSRAGIKPVLITHEARKDEEVVLKVLEAAGGGVPVIREPDVLRLKGLLGRCFVVVGSRYHALVGALSQGIPCLAFGWSHKYGYLLSDYGCPEYLIGPETSVDDVGAKIERLVAEPGRSALTRLLAGAAAAQKQKTNEMWKRVEALLQP